MYLLDKYKFAQPSLVLSVCGPPYVNAQYAMRDMISQVSNNNAVDLHVQKTSSDPTVEIAFIFL